MEYECLNSGKFITRLIKDLEVTSIQKNTEIPKKNSAFELIMYYKLTLFQY